MKNAIFGIFSVGGLAAALCSSSPAIAERFVCGVYPARVVAHLMPVRPAPPCPYQGDYIVNQGPVYDGPAVIAPQPTYSPSPSVGYVQGYYRTTRVVRRTTKVRTTRKVVNVKNELPSVEGSPQVVHARAEVRIYGPQRMDIRLYRPTER
jgi:hypothetical protein